MNAGPNATPHIFTLTGNLLAERTVEFDGWSLGKTQRAVRESFQVGGKGINVSKMLSRLGTPNTALCFIFLGVALLLRQTLPTVDSKRKPAARLCATMPVLLGLLTLAEYFTGYDLRLDELLFREPLSAATSTRAGRAAARRTAHSAVRSARR